MGLVSYREDLITANLEGQATPLPRAAAPSHPCPFCGCGFAHKKELSVHIASTHQGERPVLLINGTEHARDHTIRQAIHAVDIAVENCTQACISTGGIASPDDSLDSLIARIANETNTVLEIELLNKFESSAEPIKQFYRLRLQIPDNSALNDVDRDFRRILASETVNMSDVDCFLRQRSTQGVVWEYADALASYVRGVLVKDGRGGSTLPSKEVDELYGRSLDILKNFRRPLACVISGLIRLAFNDFSSSHERTRFDRLDHCHAVLAPTINHDLPRSVKNENDDKPKTGRPVPLCPLDRGLNTVLSLAYHVNDQHASLTKYRQTLERPTLTSRDRAKICALHAIAALKSSAALEARDALSQLRNERPFDQWASRELDRLNG